ncbi:hypothetical protein EYF80_046921 [Liparis tanakae]|uniref:Uncharacterized protein n=1 Tax=Liparis tanakae TaxID=230148 RepID=A0A4Z2FQ94_9TELE|nr:hypothetical protein EYF80_046921 [Liparis tanakae]
MKHVRHNNSNPKVRFARPTYLWSSVVPRGSADRGSGRPSRRPWRHRASLPARWATFCCAARRRVRSTLELWLLSSSSCTRASSPCSFRLCSCSI